MNDKVKVWDMPVRVFHWLLAVSFAGAYALSESERLRNVHVMLGYTVLGLLAFRLAWGFAGTRYARFRSFAYSPVAAVRHLRDEVTGRAARYMGHNPAGSWAIYGLLMLGAATGVTGYLTFNEVGGEAFEEVHEVLANAWLLLVIVHVIAVLLSSVVHRENLVRSMITGDKPGTLDEAAPRNARALGVTLAAAVLGFWAWSLSGFDTTRGSLAYAGDAGHSELAVDDENDDD
jgi:cytochrome b